MTWHKVDVRVQCSPRLRQVARDNGADVGAQATLVWLAVLAANAEHDCDGTLPAMVSDPGYLATFCPLVPLEQLPWLLQLLQHVGLVELRGDGSLHVLGWDPTWRAVKPSTARVRLHRELQRQKHQAGGAGKGGGT